MKIISFIFCFLFFCVSCFACKMDDVKTKQVQQQLLAMGYSLQQVQEMINNLNQLRIDLYNSNLSNKQLANITDKIINSNNPYAILTNQHIKNGVVTTVASMGDAQFTNIALQNIVVKQGGQIQSTVTGQTQSGHRITNIIANNVTQRYDTTTTARNAKTKTVAAQLKKIEKIQIANVPTVTATATVDKKTAKKIVIISNKKVFYQDAGQSVVINGIIKKK